MAGALSTWSVTTLTLALFSGGLLYATAFAVATDPTQKTPAPALLFVVVMLGGPVVSWLGLRRGGAPMRTVLRRGFMLGAAEWVLRGVVGYAVAGRNAATLAAKAHATSGAAPLNAVDIAHKMAVTSAGGSLLMATVCLVCFVIATYVGVRAKAPVVAVSA